MKTQMTKVWGLHVYVLLLGKQGEQSGLPLKFSPECASKGLLNGSNLANGGGLFSEFTNTFSCRAQQ